MCMHEDQNCSRYCPCDCMNCLVAHDHDTRPTSQERRVRRVRTVKLPDSPAPELTAYLRAMHPEIIARYGS